MYAIKRQYQFNNVRYIRTTCQENLPKINSRYLYYVLEFRNKSQYEFSFYFFDRIKTGDLFKFQVTPMAPVSSSRRTRVTMGDATLIKFPTCQTNYMRDPIADPETGHMSYIQ